MFKRVFVVFTLLMLVFSVVAHAQAEDKIALVSLQKALNEVNEGKKAKVDLQKNYETRKKQIDVMKIELEKLSQELEKEQMVLSKDALKLKTQDLQKKYLDLQNKAATYERELKTSEADSANKILTALKSLVGKVSQQEGYTLVIENSAQTVLFSSKAEDITPKIIAAYNKGDR